MSLKNSQYNAVMRRYDSIQLMHRHELDLRKEEVAQAIPEYAAITDELASLNAGRARRKILGLPEDPAKDAEKVSALLARQEALLTAHGYPQDYLEMTYTCPDCKDTGMIGDEKCHCFKQAMVDLLYKQSAIYDVLEKENFRAFNLGYYSKTPDKRLGISPYDNIRAVLSSCKQFIDQFESHPGNLLFYGDTGVGKTFLTNCIAGELLKRSHTVIYLSAFQLVEILSQYTFGSDDEDENFPEDMYSYIFDCDLLIIDDLGSEMNNAFVSSGLFLCINERLIRRKSTIISTNLSLDDLQNHYSERIFSRLISNYEILLLLGDDIRIKKAIS